MLAVEWIPTKAPAVADPLNGPSLSTPGGLIAVRNDGPVAGERFASHLGAVLGDRDVKQAVAQVGEMPFGDREDPGRGRLMTSLSEPIGLAKKRTFGRSGPWGASATASETIRRGMRLCIKSPFPSSIRGLGRPGEPRVLPHGKEKSARRPPPSKARIRRLGRGGASEAALGSYVQSVYVPVRGLTLSPRSFGDSSAGGVSALSAFQERPMVFSQHPARSVGDRA